MYVKNNLLSDESIIYWTRPHWVIFFTPTVILLLSILIYLYGQRFFHLGLMVYTFQLHEVISLIFLVIAVVMGLAAYIRYETTEYAITSRRVLMKTGWISRNVLELFLTKIEAIHINQTITGRLLNFGTMIIVGMGGTGDPFPYVPDPLNFRRLTQMEMNKVDRSAPLQPHPRRDSN